jgi:hypothetical protein
LLFLIFIKDLPKFVDDKSVPILFADDTSILLSHSNPTDSNNILTQYLEFYVIGLNKTYTLLPSCLHRASTVSKHFFINPTDAHNYKITGMLKQLKFPQLL